MLEILISSTVLILALTALRFFLRGKLNPRLQYALWLLAALRLLLPVSLVRSPVSVMNAVPDVPAAVQRLTAPEDRRAPQTDNTQSPVQTASETETAPTEAQMQLTGSTILKLVWLTGAAAMALAVLAQNLLFLRRLKRIRRPIACPESPVPVWLASGLPSPCLAGLFRPEIYLTPEAAQNPETRQFVLRHELAHYHARDQLWSLLRLICQCLYWFDPFVWLAAALSRRDCELACDERVLKDLDPGSRVSYGRALLGLVAPKRARGQLLSCATTMQLGRKSLKERITLIAKKPKMAAYTLVFVLVLSLVLTACTFTGAPVQPEPDPVPEPVHDRTGAASTDLWRRKRHLIRKRPSPSRTTRRQSFQMAFPMLNYASFQRYLDEHPETLENGWEHIRINEAGFDDEGTSIETQQGDQVLAVDAEYGILLVRITGDGYRGVLAICRYPELLRLEMAENYGVEGELAGSVASRAGGILAMNANGFQDPDGKGSGGQLAGWCMAQGEEHGYHFGGDVYQRIELSENGFDCRIVPASDPVGEGTYNAVEFTPVLIRDGEKIEDSFWTGEQPRACFGTSTQGIYMLVIEGRYPDEGIRGTSVNTCSDILLSYGCWNALNMDGGSSAILWYDGEYVTQSSSSFLRYTGGRPLPNAWVYG
ncbi:MAG: M56 family metallopeptidase [Oscillospiraceae bacterium]